MVVLDRGRLGLGVPSRSWMCAHRTVLIILVERSPFQILLRKKILLSREMLMRVLFLAGLRLLGVGG
jgi:hypothetical protein